MLRPVGPWIVDQRRGTQLVSAPPCNYSGRHSRPACAPGARPPRGLRCPHRNSPTCSPLLHPDFMYFKQHLIEGYTSQCIHNALQCRAAARKWT